MPEIILARRGFLIGLASALAAPAIIRPGVLMPIKSIILPEPVTLLKGSTDGINWELIDSIKLSIDKLMMAPLYDAGCNDAAIRIGPTIYSSGHRYYRLEPK